MPKPPTELRGRQTRVAPAPPPQPRRRFARSAPAARRSLPAAVREVPSPVVVRERRWSWRKVVTPLASLAGLGVSTYLTLAHYTTAVQIACPENATINCEKVTTSPQSIVFGIPVAVLGLAFFVAMVVVNAPMAWRSRSRLIPWARLGLAVTGIGFISYLVYAELYVIHAICLWCTSVHVLTFILFVAIVTGWEEATAPWYDDDAVTEADASA